MIPADDNAARYEAAGATSDAFLNSWASGYFPDPAVGPPWEFDGPGLPADPGPKPLSLSAANGKAAPFSAAAVTNAIYSLSSSADIIVFDVRGHARLGDPGDLQDYVLGSGSFCTSGVGGSEVAVRVDRRSGGPGGRTAQGLEREGRGRATGGGDRGEAVGEVAGVGDVSASSRHENGVLVQSARAPVVLEAWYTDNDVDSTSSGVQSVGRPVHRLMHQPPQEYGRCAICLGGGVPSKVAGGTAERRVRNQRAVPTDRREVLEATRSWRTRSSRLSRLSHGVVIASPSRPQTPCPAPIFLRRTATGLRVRVSLCTGSARAQAAGGCASHTLRSTISTRPCPMSAHPLTGAGDTRWASTPAASQLATRRSSPRLRRRGSS